MAFPSLRTRPARFRAAAGLLLLVAAYLARGTRGRALAVEPPQGASDRPAGAVLYLSPHGDDRWSGGLASPLADRTDGPVATLQGARDAVRRFRASNKTPRGRDGADLVAGQGARARRMGDQAYSAVAAAAAAKAGCAKPERHRHATKDARPCGLRLGPSSAVSRLLAVPDPSTSPSPLLSATRPFDRLMALSEVEGPEAQRGSRGVLLEALRAACSRRVAGQDLAKRMR